MHKTVSMGKDYYIAFPKNAYGDQRTAVLINSPVKQQLTITRPGTGTQYALSIQPGIANIHERIDSIFHIDSVSEEIDLMGAVHIQGIATFDVIGQYGIAPHISSTYTAIPVSGWGTDYYVLDEEEGVNEVEYADYPQVYSVPDMTIIASQNNTVDTITPTTMTEKERPAGVAFKVKLNAGDTYYVSDAADPQIQTASSRQTHAPMISPAPQFMPITPSASSSAKAGNPSHAVRTAGIFAATRHRNGCRRYAIGSVYVVTPRAPNESDGES